MSDDERPTNPFAGPLAAMEAEIAAAEARGDPVMPQAYAMVVRLRELMGALSGLEASLAATGVPLVPLVPPVPPDSAPAAPPSSNAPADDPDEHEG